MVESLVLYINASFCGNSSSAATIGIAFPVISKTGSKTGSELIFKFMKTLKVVITKITTVQINTLFAVDVQDQEAAMLRN